MKTEIPGSATSHPPNICPARLVGKLLKKPEKNLAGISNEMESLTVRDHEGIMNGAIKVPAGRDG